LEEVSNLRELAGIFTKHVFGLDYRFVIHSGKTGVNNEHTHVIEYGLKLDSNPEFTSSVLVCYARAAYKMNKEGMCGCKTVFDVAPKYLSSMSDEYMREHLL